MADTITPAASTVEQWEKSFFVEYLQRHFFNKYMGKDENSLIQVNEKLAEDVGDKVTFSLIHNLSGDGTSGSDTLEGNEEALQQRSFSVIIDQYRNAVRLKAFELKKNAVDQMRAVKPALSNWINELDRNKLIDALNSTGQNPTTGKSYYKVASAGEATVGTKFTAASETQMNTWLTNNSDRVLFGRAKANNAANVHADALAAIDETDTLSAGALSLLKRIAKAANPKIRPYKPRKSAEGSAMFVLFCPPLLIRDLTADAEFVSANREARERGRKNPLFADADYIYKNIAIIEVEDIPVFEGVGAAGIDVSPTFLCGAQALAMGFGLKPKSIKEDFDYGDKKGRGIKVWYEIAKMQFDRDGDEGQSLVDHGVVTGYFASVADS